MCFEIKVTLTSISQTDFKQTTVWQRLFMREWKALNVRGCGSGSKSKICESEFNFQCLWGSLWLQPEAIPYILSKLTTELYPGILSLTHTVRKQKYGLHVPVVIVDSYLHMYRCFHRMYATKTAWEEEKVNWILSAKVVFLNNEKGARDRYKLPAIRHFTPFKKDAKKMAREPREPGI